VTEFMVLQHPKLFGSYYVALVTYLMLLRLYMYAKNRWLYFLIDFCYAVNLSCFVSVLYAPNNAMLWRLNYATSNGTLLGAMLAWRNSLVFHSLDKVTSIAIHVLPALLTYLERWSTTDPPVMTPANAAEDCEGHTSRVHSIMCLASATTGSDQGDSDDNHCSIGLTGSILEPIIFYFCWQVLYIIKTEIIDRPRMLADPSIQTSLRWLTRDSKNVMHRVAKRVCRATGILAPDEDFDPEATKTKMVFWIGQLIFTVLTLIPVPFLFASYTVNTAYILFVLSAAVYNGSNYYFEIFASRYLQQLEDKAARAAEDELQLQQQLLQERGVAAESTGEEGPPSASEEDSDAVKNGGEQIKED